MGEDGGSKGPGELQDGRRNRAGGSGVVQSRNLQKEVTKEVNILFFLDSRLGLQSEETGKSNICLLTPFYVHLAPQSRPLRDKETRKCRC